MVHRKLLNKQKKKKKTHTHTYNDHARKCMGMWNIKKLYQDHFFKNKAIRLVTNILYTLNKRTLSRESGPT